MIGDVSSIISISHHYSGIRSKYRLYDIILSGIICVSYMDKSEVRNKRRGMFTIYIPTVEETIADKMTRNRVLIVNDIKFACY